MTDHDRTKNPDDTYLVCIGANDQGYRLYLIDEEKSRVGYYGIHKNPHNDDLATYSTRDEAEGVYERICETDPIAKQIGGVVTLAEARTSYQEIA